MSVLKIKNNTTGRWVGITTIRGEKGEKGEGGGGSFVGDYKWAKIGYARNQVRDFQGWAHCVRFDRELGVSVGLVISGNGSHSNVYPPHRVTIDTNGHMSDYTPIKMYNDSGNELTTGYIGSFTILSDMTYILCNNRGWVLTSADKGYTWTYLSRVTPGGRSTYSNDSLWNITELSNGRLLAGNVGDKYLETYYSDDKGLTWTTVAMQSTLGFRPDKDLKYTPFEPLFIEIGDGKVIQYARGSMSAPRTASSGAYAKDEPAAISLSTDYGTTWSAWEWSSSMVHMSACNAKAVVIDGIVHAVWGHRYKNYVAKDGSTPYFAMFYSHATLEEAWNDEFAAPVEIDVGHWPAEATNYCDAGYPSLVADDANNLMCIYYDSDGTGGDYTANWRICIGAPVIRKPSVSDVGSGARNVSYSQLAIDKKFLAYQAKINELLLLIGELPDDSGDYDGTWPINDHLCVWFDVTDTSKYSNGVLTAKIGQFSALTKNSSPSGQTPPANVTSLSYNNGFASFGLLYMGTANNNEYKIQNIVGETPEAITIEFCCYQKSETTQYVLKIFDTPTVNALNTPVYQRSANIGGTYMYGAPHHFVAVFRDNAIDWYVDGVFRLTETTSLTIADLLNYYVNPNAHNSASGAALGDFRMYSKALSLDEIKNNYRYTQIETDYTVNPVFS